jgi:hypothetical protein
MAAVDDHVAWHAGRPEREKACEAERPKALVTVAVTVIPDEEQEGAVHTTWLVEGVFCAVAREPVLALQANVRELD